MPPAERPDPSFDGKEIKKEEDDFENCKGQCGYTIWCRECMANRKKELSEAESDTDYRTD
jgi:hypothetical protein